MSCSLQSLRRANLLLCLGLFLHCEARVHTEVQAGPLYRVVDSLLSITCNVSGFTDADAEKEFEFRLKKPGTSLEINVISTHKQDFSYSMFSSRVRSKEVTLTHVSPNSVVFKIERLLKGDEGEYDCTAVNIEEDYNGIYSVQTTVNVIDNSLSVSSPATTSLSYNEGDALTLTCQASSNTVQHTHLSLSWYLHKDGEAEAQPIISLNRDFTLSPGQGFEGRYQAGLIRLDKVGEATYKLKMAQLELSDQGRIYCQAQEWIQDPDRSWYSIVQKKAAETTVTVKAREVVPDTSSLLVRISAQQTTLQEGQELSLSCTVDTQNLEEKFFSVAWFRESIKMAEIGPTGILSVGPSYSERSKEGELRAARTGARDYHLKLQPIRTEDQGQYFCRAWPSDRGQDGAFTQRAAQDSSPQLISISATESGLSLSMQSSVSVNKGDSLRLACTVQGVKGLLSVTWQHKASSTATAAFTRVISLSQEGVMEKAEEFMSRKIRATRPAADSFTLEFDEVTLADSGVYQCTVSEWKTDKTKTNSQSQTATVTVDPTDKFVKVSLVSRKSAVALGESVELMCRVKGPRVPITLTWSLQRDSSSNPDTILTLYSNGGISWFGDESTYQLRVENKNNEVVHYLLINGASQRESGSYQCSVSVFRENVYKKLPPSNQLALSVQNPVSKLAVTTALSLTSDVNTDVEIKCSVITETSPSSRYAVTWLLQEGAENKTIISSDRDALITFGPQVEQSLRQRISMRRAKGPSFELTIRRAEVSDKGSYICQVVEWIQAPRGEWYQLSQVFRTTKITVTEPVSKLAVTSTPTLTSDINTDVEIKCSVTSETPASSRYAVTWLLQQGAENKTIISSDRDALITFGPQVEQSLRQRISMKRTKGPSFELTIRQTQISDKGSYICEVVEWLQDPRGEWYQLSQVSETTEIILIEPANDLRLEKIEQRLTTSEGNEVEVTCNIISGATSPSFFYKVSWFYTGPGSSVTNTLVELDHTGLLSYLESEGLRGLQRRLRLSRPTQNSFYLGIQRAHEEDSGTYKCRVEQYQLDRDGQWQQRASEDGGPTTLTVNLAGKNLSVLKEAKELNRSTSQDFTIPCHITKQSSNESEFQVTWFWQKETGNKQSPIFTAYRNSTLEDKSGNAVQLRFSHALPNQFSLMVIKPNPEHRGLYYCEVEEWLQSLSHGWRKVAVETSGNLTVHVYAEGRANAHSEPPCRSGMWIGIFVAFVICTIVAVAMVVVKIFHNKGKKSEPSLWAEQPLNPKPSAED
ncbi:immunoglobulin superfamily member 3 isoform X2 [Larimichthys crocea]|uniref:immunoglobulin superfamily member 3 isoform X2 n=1 Tax=Larimichthys crocea TaxID=215358 RepID=UPI000F5E374C|nr:immunoglobulin superfamily member 3 isoform X2 [Larimichthys crocea]